MYFNEVILGGNIGQSPKITKFKDGGKVANFSLAVTKPAITTREGRKIEAKTYWANIVARNGLADIVERFVQKGDPLLVQGELTERTYTDNSGQTRYVTEISATNIQLLGGRKESKKEGGYRPMNDYPEN